VHGAQRSAQWLEARKNLVVSASEAPLLMNESMPDGFEALVERRWNPEPVVENDDMRRGKELEGEALRVLEEKLKTTIYSNFGLVLHPDDREIGASPDGITAAGELVEIKCPRTKKAFGGSVPKRNRAQVDMACACLPASNFIFAQYAEGEINIIWGQARQLPFVAAKDELKEAVRANAPSFVFTQDRIQASAPIEQA